MKIEDRIELAVQTVAQFNPDSLPALEGMPPEDIARISLDMDLKEKDMPKLVGTIIYIKKRLIEKMSRVDSFRCAFPERCIATGQDAGGKFGTTAEKGSPVHKTTIDVKAKRIEASTMYQGVYTVLQTNLYVTYATDRLRVLDEVLDSAMDRGIATRDRHNYMKLFLDETRKPEGARAMEMNVNIQNNTVNVATVEDKMNTIAQALNHATASEVIDMISGVRTVEDD